MPLQAYLFWVAVVAASGWTPSARALLTEAYEKSDCGPGGTGTFDIIHSTGWDGFEDCVEKFGPTFVNDVLANGMETFKNHSIFQSGIRSPSSRGMCVTITLDGANASEVLRVPASPVTVLLGIGRFQACATVACKEDVACHDFVVDEDELELERVNCTESCAQEHLRCVAYTSSTRLKALYPPPTMDNSMIAYGDDVLVVYDKNARRSFTVTLGPFGLASSEEDILGVAFCALTVLVLVLVLRCHAIDYFLSSIFKLMAACVRRLKGRTKGDSFMPGDTVVVWNTVEGEWKRAKITKHIHRLRLEWTSTDRRNHRKWIDDTARDKFGLLISQHSMAEWKKIHVGDNVEARPVIDTENWVKATIGEIKRIVVVNMDRPRRVQGGKHHSYVVGHGQAEVEFLVPSSRIRTVERHESTLHKNIRKHLPLKKSHVSEESENHHQMDHQELGSDGDSNKPRLRVNCRTTTMVLVVMVILRTGSFVLRVFKLVFNVTLMLQTVAMTDIARTAYLESLKEAVQSSCSFLRLPDVSFAVDWPVFNLAFLPFKGHSLNNLCPGVLLSMSLFVSICLCVLTYTLEQGNLLFLIATVMEAVKHGHGKMIVSFINQISQLSSGLVLYALVIFMNITSSLLYTLFDVVLMGQYTCGTVDTVVFYTALCLLVVLTPVVLILFLKGFSENKDDEHKKSTVDKVFLPDPSVRHHLRCSCRRKPAAVSPNKKQRGEQAECHTPAHHRTKCTVALDYVYSLCVSVMGSLVVLLKVTFGWWDHDTISHFNILGKMAEFNTDSHESVMTITSKSSSLFWLIFARPLVVLAKIGEVTSDPPLNLAKHPDLIFEGSQVARTRDWILNIITLALTVAAASMRTCTVFVILILWVICLEGITLIVDVKTLIDEHRDREKHRPRTEEAKSSEGEEEDLEELARRKRYGF